MIGTFTVCRDSVGVAKIRSGISEFSWLKLCPSERTKRIDVFVSQVQRANVDFTVERASTAQQIDSVNLTTAVVIYLTFNLFSQQGKNILLFSKFWPFLSVFLD